MVVVFVRVVTLKDDMSICLLVEMDAAGVISEVEFETNEDLRATNVLYLQTSADSSDEACDSIDYASDKEVVSVDTEDEVFVPAGKGTWAKS